MKITVTFEQHQLKNQAMCKLGFNPQAMAIKPGQRKHANQKLNAARGKVKHKGKFDFN